MMGRNVTALSKGLAVTHRYVVLLRGVNIGGRKRVPKAEQKSVLEGVGFTEVEVYINSGNAVGTHTGKPVVAEVQSALEAHFDFEVPTLLLRGDQVQAIAQAVPEHWRNDSPNPEKTGYQSNVVYLFDELDSPEVLDKLGYRTEIETMIYVPGAVIQSVSRVNQPKGALAKVVGTKAYLQMTVRNVNTARKLAEMVDAPA